MDLSAPPAPLWPVRSIPSDSTRLRREILVSCSVWTGVLPTSIPSRRLFQNIPSPPTTYDSQTNHHPHHQFSPHTELLLQNASAPASSVVDTWADTSYTPASARRADNFTALIWKSSNSIGCGRQQCSDKPTNSPFYDPAALAAKAKDKVDQWGEGKLKDDSEGEGELGVIHGNPPAKAGSGGAKADGWFVVCEVAPQGNVEGQYTQNVDGWGDGSGRGEGWRQEGVLGKSKDSGAGMSAGAGKERIAVWAGWVFTGLAVAMGMWA
ncbi:hypothetical protein BKA81DRAFT_347474 [Phyllosticta paracitricarpa]